MMRETSRHFAMIPIPLFVLDELMPTLRDTEVRVLLVVLRQTANKERDWLSSRQLQARTGRSSDAVSGAIETLVRRGLLVVTGEEGSLLAGAAERRRYRRRQFFAQGPLLRSSQPGRQSARNGAIR